MSFVMSQILFLHLKKGDGNIYDRVKYHVNSETLKLQSAIIIEDINHQYRQYV